jgi:hypothetical protein
MNYNYIGIDTSLSSTGLYICLKDGSEHYYNYRNTDKLTKWHKILDFINYFDYQNIKLDNYSDTEIAKIIQYNKVTDQMVTDILKHCIPQETKIITEGYSYSSSNTSSLIDLISYATLLRNKLIQLDFNDFIIKSPSTLKLDCCKSTYIPIEKIIGGKKPRIELIYRNDEGIAGGKFTKREMLKSIFDHPNVNVYIQKILDFHIVDLLKMKNIPKPIDDVVDAVWLAWTEILVNENLIN